MKIYRKTYVGNIRYFNLDTLALTHVGNSLTDHGGGVKWRSTLEDLPVVEDLLREGLATGGGTEIGGETERLHDG